MKFIFPKNYKFTSKLLGFIDYTSAFLIITWAVILLLILNLFINDINIKIFAFISLFFPFFLFIVINNSKENILFTISYIMKFFYNKDVYLYDKTIESSLYVPSKKQNLYFIKIEKFINALLN